MIDARMMTTTENFWNSTKYMTIPHPIDVAIPQTAKLSVKDIRDERVRHARIVATDKTAMIKATMMFPVS